MLFAALDNFYLTPEELENSPSRKDGIDRETETTLRLYGCQIIQEATVLLGLPQVAACTGMVLYQRFFCKRSFKEISAQVRAPGGMWNVISTGCRCRRR